MRKQYNANSGQNTTQHDIRPHTLYMQYIFTPIVKPAPCEYVYEYVNIYVVICGGGRSCTCVELVN